jgi:hypothetical protein
MHSQNPFLDEFAKLTQAAMGIAQTAGEEAKTAMRAQADRSWRRVRPDPPRRFRGPEGRGGGVARRSRRR